MKLDCGLSYQEKIEKYQEWHPFFAVWPRRVGHRDCRFLEWIERKGCYEPLYIGICSPWEWRYRAKKGK